jgi:predicted permease
LIEGIFGNEGLANIAMFDVGNAFIMFGLIYIIGSIFSPEFDSEHKISYKEILKRVSKNIPLLSYIIALILNMGFGGFSGVFYDIFDIIAKANNGLVLLLLGIYLSFTVEKENWNRILKVLILRYGGGLIAGLICYFFLPFDEFFKSILVISFILPIGMSVIPFVIQFKYDQKLVRITGTITNLTIIISFGLMWLILVILNI